MSKYIVLATDSNGFLAAFDSYNEADECAKQLMEIIDIKTCVMEVISTHSLVIDSYEGARTYLGIDAKNHQKAMSALEKLIVIAEAWNKQDGFVPDFSNRNQYKYFPGLVYNDKSAGFVYDGSYITSTDVESVLGSRLCFISEERAAQFGEQFINLWNDFLLFR